MTKKDREKSKRRKEASQRWHQAQEAKRKIEQEENGYTGIVNQSDFTEPVEQTRTVTYSFRMENGNPYVYSHRDKRMSYEEISNLTGGFEDREIAELALDITIEILNEREEIPKNIEKIITETKSGLPIVGALIVEGTSNIHGYIAAELRGENYASGRHKKQQGD